MTYTAHIFVLFFLATQAKFNLGPLPAGKIGTGPTELLIASAHKTLMSRYYTPCNIFTKTVRPDVHCRIGYTGVLEVIDLIDEPDKSVLPDIIMCSSSPAGYMIKDQPQINKTGIYEPLSQYFKGSYPKLKYFLDQAIPLSAQYDCKINGEWYCLPIFLSEYGMSYNPITLAKYNISIPPLTSVLEDKKRYWSFDEFFDKIKTLSKYVKIPWAGDPYIAITDFTAWIQSSGEQLRDPKTKKCNWMNTKVAKMLKEQWFPMMRRSPDMAKMRAGKCYHEHYDPTKNNCTDYADVEGYLNTPLDQWPDNKPLRLNSGTGIVPNYLKAFGTIGSGGASTFFPGNVVPRNGWYIGINKFASQEKKDLAYQFIEFMWNFNNLSAPWPKYNIAGAADIMNMVTMQSDDPIISTTYSTATAKARLYKRKRAVSMTSPDEADEYTWNFEMVNAVGRMCLDAIHPDGLSDDRIIQRACTLVDVGFNPERLNCIAGTEWDGNKCSQRFLRQDDELVAIYSVQQSTYPFMSFVYTVVGHFLATLAVEHGVTNYYRYMESKSIISSTQLHTKRYMYYNLWIYAGQFFDSIGIWSLIITLVSDVQYVAYSPNISGKVNVLVGDTASVVSVLPIIIMIIIRSFILKYQDDKLLMNVYKLKMKERQRDDTSMMGLPVSDDMETGTQTKYLVPISAPSHFNLHNSRKISSRIIFWIASRKNIWWFIVIALGGLISLDVCIIMLLSPGNVSVTPNAGNAIISMIGFIAIMELTSYIIVWGYFIQQIILVFVRPFMLIHLIWYGMNNASIYYTSESRIGFEYNIILAIIAAIILVSFGSLIYAITSSGQVTSDRAAREVKYLNGIIEDRSKELIKLENENLKLKDHNTLLNKIILLTQAMLPPNIDSSYSELLYKYVPLDETKTLQPVVKEEFITRNFTKNPLLSTLVRDISTLSRSVECPLFVIWVECIYHKYNNDRTEIAKDIYNIFIADNAPLLININSAMKSTIDASLKNAPKNLFDAAVAEMKRLMEINELAKWIKVCKDTDIDYRALISDMMKIDVSSPTQHNRNITSKEILSASIAMSSNSNN